MLVFWSSEWSEREGFGRRRFGALFLLLECMVHNWFGGGSSLLQMDQQDGGYPRFGFAEYGIGTFLIGIKRPTGQNLHSPNSHSFIVNWGKW